MKNFKLNFKSIVQRKARWLVTILALMTLGVGQIWADSSKDYMFSGQRLYISCSGWLDDGAIIKINLYGTDGKFSKYIMASDFDRSNSLLYIDIDGQYKGFQIIRLNPDNQEQQWNHTATIWADQRSDENQNCITPGYKIDNDGESTISWGTHSYTLTQNKYVYFVNEATNWSQPHFRIGKTTYTNAFDMTREPGTANLWVYRKTDSDWSGYNAFTITDGGGWTDNNDVFNPNAITNRTIYWYENVSDDITIIAGSNGGTVTNPSPNTDWYNATKNDGLTTYTVSTSTSHCTVEMEKYENDAGTSTTTLASGGTVLPTQYIKVTTTPATGYQFSSVSVSNSTTVTTATSSVPGVYYITGDATVTATCSAKTYTITLDDNGGASGDGTHTVTYDAVVGSLTNTPIKTNYAFCGYQTSSGVKIFNADKTPISSVEGYTDASGNWIKDGGETLYAIWEDQWCIKGNAGDDGVDDAMGDWDNFNSLPYVSGTTYRGSISLDANTTYSFKVVDRVNNAWYGKESISITREGTTSISGDFESGKGDTYILSITTDVAGSYTFEWNTASTKSLIVTYPDAYKVTYDANGSSSGEVPDAGTYYVPNATVTVLGDGTLEKSGHTFLGWNTRADGLGTDYVEDNVFTITGDITLYAKWRNDAYEGKYTFHYGNYSTGTWTILPFPAEPTRSKVTDAFQDYYYTIENFTMPDPATYPNFFVGYEGYMKAQLGLRNTSASEVHQWSDYTGTNLGQFDVKPGSMKISDGSNTAVGAIGTIEILKSSSAEGVNLSPGLIPSGYGLTIRNGSGVTTRTLEFNRSKSNPDIWETDILEGGLTAEEIAGTFKVGLATATDDEYVDCFQSNWADADALNVNKDECDQYGSGGQNYPNLSAGKKGRFQLVINIQNKAAGPQNQNKENFALRYVTLDNWTLSSGTWGGDWISGTTLSSKWSLGHAPTIDEDVYLYHSTSISGQMNAQAKSIKIYKDTEERKYNRLTIDEYRGGLLVQEDILVKHLGEEEFGATTKEDLQIESSYLTNAALITGKKSTNTEATYLFHTKSYKAGSYGYINQFIGIPFVEMNAYEFYDAWLYQYDAGRDKWVTCYTTMVADSAYNLLRKAPDGRGFYYLDGTLNLPGIEGEDRLKKLECKTGRYGEASSWAGEHLFANSWTAPIEVSAMEESDFYNVDPTIYVFNAGSVKSGATDEERTQYELGDNPGQWTALPVLDVKANPGNYAYKVIPGTQAFQVRATAVNGYLTLDYKKHVYDPAINNKTIDSTSLRAPMHYRGNASERLTMVVTGESLYKDETYIHERADFTEGHDAGWDGYKITGSAHSPQLYTVSDNNKMSVNAIPEMNGTVVGFQKGSDDDVYTFSFVYEGNRTLYLIDTKDQTSTLISNDETYTFISESDDVEQRFYISDTPYYVPVVATGVGEVSSEKDLKARKILIHDHIYILRGGKMYNVDGKMVK